MSQPCFGILLERWSEGACCLRIRRQRSWSCVTQPLLVRPARAAPNIHLQRRTDCQRFVCDPKAPAFACFPETNVIAEWLIAISVKVLLQAFTCQDSISAIARDQYSMEYGIRRCSHLRTWRNFRTSA